MAEEEVGANTPEVLTARGPPGSRRRGEERGSDGVCPIRRGAATPLFLLSILLPLLLLSGNALGQQPQRQNKQPAVAKKAARPGRAKTVTDLFNTSSCADPPYRCPYPRIEFYLYTRSTQEEPEKLDLLKDAGPSLMETHFDAAHPTKIVIHGFGGGRKLSPSPDMRKAYFTRGEYNVIIVDYSSLVVEPCLSQVEWGPRFCALCIAQLIGWLDDAWQWSIRSLVAANRVARQAPTASRWIDFDDRQEYEDGEEGAEPSADDGNFGQRVVQSIGRVVVDGRGKGGVSRGHGGYPRGGDGGVPRGGGWVPRGEGGVPRGEGEASRGGGWIHWGEDGVPRGEGGVPRGGGGVPRGGGWVHRGEGGVPRGEDGVPRGESGVPRGSGGVSRDKDGVLMGESGARMVSHGVVTRVGEGGVRGDGHGVTSADGLSDTRGGRAGVVARVRGGGARGDGNGVTTAANSLDDAREGGARDAVDTRGGEGGRWEVITESPRRLLRFVGSPPQGVHVIGYSVGAHIAGLLANYVGARKIGRITGLDPTIIFYMGNNRSRDLDPTDALFVDVIHTGAGVLGQWGPNGHVDFYVNGGTSQPGCTGGIYETLACDHQKVTPYFIESITSEKGFWATPCTNLLLYLIGWCTTTDESKLIKMGEDVPISARGIYYLETNARRPYAKGRPSDNTRRKRRGRG